MEETGHLNFLYSRQTANIFNSLKKVPLWMHMLNNLHGDTFFKTATRVSSGTVERFQRSDHPRDNRNCHPGCVDYDLEYGS